MNRLAVTACVIACTSLCLACGGFVANRPPKDKPAPAPAKDKPPAGKHYQSAEFERVVVGKTPAEVRQLLGAPTNITGPKPLLPEGDPNYSAAWHYVRPDNFSVGPDFSGEKYGKTTISFAGGKASNVTH
jgi:hypothetical protein